MSTPLEPPHNLLVQQEPTTLIPALPAQAPVWMPMRATTWLAQGLHPKLHVQQEPINLQLGNQVACILMLVTMLTQVAPHLKPNVLLELINL